jgi:hypothetical protein
MMPDVSRQRGGLIRKDRTSKDMSLDIRPKETENFTQGFGGEIS